MNLGKFDCATGLINILYTKGDLIVRNATETDITFIDKLQKDNSYAVGFIQRTVWDNYVFGGGVILSYLFVKKIMTKWVTFFLRRAKDITLIPVFNKLQLETMQGVWITDPRLLRLFEIFAKHFNEPAHDYAAAQI